MARRELTAEHAGLLDLASARTRADRVGGGVEIVLGGRGQVPVRADSQSRLVHLAALVMALHEDQHAEPARYCTAACREAEEVLGQ